MDTSGLLKAGQRPDASAAKFETASGPGHGRLVLRSAVMINALVLLKALLFGKPAEDSGAPARPPPSEDQTSHAGAEEAPTEEAPLADELPPHEEELPAAPARAKGNGVSPRPSVASFEPERPPEAHTPLFERSPYSPLPLASNDDMPLIDIAVLAGPGRAAPAGGDDGGGDDGGGDRAGGKDDASGGGGDGDEDGVGSGDGPDGEDGDGEDDDDGHDGGEDAGGDDATRSNRAPVVAGPVRLRETLVNQAIVIAAADLLRFAHDPDGDVLAITGLDAKGATLTELADGLWRLTPDLDFTGEASISFAVGDGAATATGIAQVQVKPLPGLVHVGTEGGETIVGTPFADVIDAQGGDDIVIGREGDDVIHGGMGSDRLLGGAGNDVLHGGEGDDVIDAGDGDDVVYGGGGNDLLIGGAGRDLLLGEDGDDVLLGGDGHDALFGGAGGDSLDGGAGDDVLVGGAGSDRIEGGSGSDLILAGLGDGDDVIDGGDGLDTLDLSVTTAAATIDLGAGVAESADIGRDTLAGIENVTGGAGDDAISGNGQSNILSGGAGNDSLDAGAGNDSIGGGSGNDVVMAAPGDGDDVIDGGDGLDTLDLSATAAEATIDLGTGVAESADIGRDTLAAIENVIGGAGDDTLYAGIGVNELAGGGGDDTFVFRTTVEAGLGQGQRDKILDFQPGDRINFKEISREFEDAFGDLLRDEGIKKFVLVASGYAFSQPGQIRFAYDGIDDVTVIEGNIDHDLETEFEIELSGRHDLEQSHFNQQMFG